VLIAADGAAGWVILTVLAALGFCAVLAAALAPVDRAALDLAFCAVPPAPAFDPVLLLLEDGDPPVEESA
jgi:hypothetical protein